MRSKAARRIGLAVVLALIATMFATSAPSARASETATLHLQPYITSGMYRPTNVELAPDGRVIVSEKAGTVKIWDGPSDPSPTLAIDLRSRVYEAGERGLLGMTIDPNWPAEPYVYLFYTKDARPGDVAPYWNDICPPETGTDGCVVTGTISRVLIGSDNRQVGAEQLLMDGFWCQQFWSHSVGDLEFGEDGALFASAGEGGSWFAADRGQVGGSPGSPTPVNPCGDPTDEGGSLRAQDPRTAGDPNGFSGSILRINPDTGAALPDNPLFGGAVADDDRYVAYGGRNPWRITHKPGTNEIFIADVGLTAFEEINRIANPLGGITNFGWPCYDGLAKHAAWDALDLDMCEDLYAEPGAVTPPALALSHGQHGSGCYSYAMSTVGFYEPTGSPTNYPSRYHDKIFFSDFSGCIWAAALDGSGNPDESTMEMVARAGNPVDLEAGPDGDFLVVEYLSGRIMRLQALEGHAPVAAVSADPSAGVAPLHVTLDASESSDEDAGDALTYDWDLNGDGEFGDATGAIVEHDFEAGFYDVVVRVSDGTFTSTASTSIEAVGEGDPPPVPVPTIANPRNDTLWRPAGAQLFSGSAVDAVGNPLDPSALAWTISAASCPAEECIYDEVQTATGESGQVNANSVDVRNIPPGASTIYLAFKLEAFADGASASTFAFLPALARNFTIKTFPEGGTVMVDGAPTTSKRMVVGSTHEFVAAPTQMIGGVEHRFAGWTGLASNFPTATLPVDSRNIRALYVPANPGPGPVAGADTMYASGTASGNVGRIAVLGNDNLPGPNPHVTSNSTPAKGIAIFDSVSQGFTYIYTGPTLTGLSTDSFTYQVCDDNAQCATGTVNVQLMPRVTLGSESMSLDGIQLDGPTSGSVNVLANDTDPLGAMQTNIEITRSPASGTLLSVNGGSVVYQLDKRTNFDTFVYSACANRVEPVVEACRESTVFVNVDFGPEPANDYVVLAPGDTIGIDLLGNDVAFASALDPYSMTVTEPNNGHILNTLGGQITYRSNPDAEGVDLFSYQICDYDEVPDCASANVYVATNRPPVAADDDATAIRGNSAFIDVLQNDEDPDGYEGFLQVEILTQPATGSAEVSDNRIRYVHDGSESATDSFAYRVCDYPELPDFPSDISYAGRRCADATAHITIEEAGIGLLRVTTEPALPSQIVVDGVPRDSFGLSWMKVSGGDHTVCFSEVAGFRTPDCRQVQVPNNGTGTTVGEFTRRGSLRVTTSPPLPSTIYVDGYPRNAWGLWTDVDEGWHNVCFGPTTGWFAPDCSEIEVIAGETATVNGSFGEDEAAEGQTGVGYLRATTNPAVPSVIRIGSDHTDATWLNTWGTEWVEMEPGDYTICFGGVVGFHIDQPCQEITINEGQTTTIQGNFVANGYLRAITSPAFPASITVNGIARNDWGFWSHFADTDPVEVCFEPVLGYATPTCQTVTLQPGNSITVTGNYVPL